ncbi:hypothetical protein [Hymenobacter terrestris]|uniref:Uncharacterized protein n=1 Tax=Hymenobacter terrestris TaxID=2748310 RepID=A0ABX2Q6D7_9BACT|nr:hypothetical protein [Hymenobacter terrestris]NVO86541.1 hypothetical protein [Hymenobacter terrestris]
MQIGKSTLSDVRLVLGKRHKTRVIPGYRSSVRFTENGMVTIKNKTSYGCLISYKKDDIHFIIRNSAQPKELHLVKRIEFGPNAPIVTSQGIQPSKNIFADVITQYGQLDTVGSNRRQVYITESTVERDGKKNSECTVLHYPKISFVSYGIWDKSKDVYQRRVDEIWL